MQMTDERPRTETDPDQDLEWSNGSGIPHPAGEYRAEFTHGSVEEREYDGQTKKRVRLHFQTEAEMPNGDPFGISVATAPSFHPKGKMRPFLIALGEDVDKLKPETFKLKDRYGKKLRLYVTHEPRKDGQGVFANISAFLPLKAGKTNGAAPGAPAARPNFDEDDE